MHIRHSIRWIGPSRERLQRIHDAHYEQALGASLHIITDFSRSLAAHLDAIPISTNHERMPKLGTMLFTAHSVAAAINAGKVVFTENPMAINCPQWITFAKYSYQQLKWGLVTKPALRDRFVLDTIDSELQSVYEDIDALFDEVTDGRTLMFPASASSL